MRRHTALAAGGAFLALGAALLACVDLFHGTDFDTLCSASPQDPACASDAAVQREVTASDAVATDSSRPPPDFCGWSNEQALTQAKRACAFLGACEGPLGESAFGPCVVRAQLAFNCNATPSLRPVGAVGAFWACLATVESCSDVDGCVFPGGVQPCRAVSGSSSACGSVGANSSVRLECAGEAGRAAGVEPCVMLGKTCSEENASTATCSGTKGFDCPASECSGAAAVDCTAAGQRTFDLGIDCSGYGGGACQPFDAGGACVPGTVAGTCSVDAPPVCIGNVATSCVNGKQTRVSCDAVGLPCDDSEPIAPYDLTAACIDRSAGACNVADACSGDSVLESCGRGARFTIDCAKLGLGKCKVNGGSRASCTAP